MAAYGNVLTCWPRRRHDAYFITGTHYLCHGCSTFIDIATMPLYEPEMT